MKKRSKYILAVLVIVLIAASFCVGRAAAGQEQRRARAERCLTLLQFALEKAETGDLADAGTMRALISNVYAACQFCDDDRSATQLHDLWNYLIFESDGDLVSAKEIALRELNAVLAAEKAAD